MTKIITVIIFTITIGIIGWNTLSVGVDNVNKHNEKRNAAMEQIFEN